jgi:hypothetical protein
MNDIKNYLPLIIRIVEWAQRHHKKVQTLTKTDLIQAIKCK